MADVSRINFKVNLNMSSTKLRICLYHHIEIQEGFTFQTDTVFIDTPGIRTTRNKIIMLMFDISLGLLQFRMMTKPLIH